SDGLDAPAAVIARAVQKGLAALALTDHDTLEGIAEGAAAAQAAGLGFLPGVEISTQYQDREVHVTALRIDPAAHSLNERLAWLRVQRATRAEAILARLHELGHSLTLPPNPNLGRLHIARALLLAG